MKKYDSYKDTGIEWIGDIPSHWEVKPVKYISNNYDGKRIPLNSSERAEKRGDFPYYGATGIVDYVNDFLFDGEFVLIGEDGAPFFIEGRDVSFIASGKFWVNNHAHVLKPKESISSILLSHYLNCVDYRNYITGSTRDKLTQDQLNSVKLPLPPPEEQTAIANYLDRKTAEIDELIANKKRLLELYEEEKTAIINQAVTKGINPDIPMKDSGIEWLGDIPEHWEMKRLKYVVTINDEALNENTDENLEIEYVEISDVKSGVGIVETSSHKFKGAPSRARRIVRDGDVIVSTVRTYLKSIAKIDNPPKNLIVSTGFAVIRPKDIDANYAGFLFYSELLIGEIISLSTGVSYPAINSSQIGDIIIPIPPSSEQQSIVHHIEAETARIDHKMSQTEKLIDLLTEYRTALISEVVTGKIKVIE